MSKSSEISKYGFTLFNCIELDQHSHDTIMEDAIVRIELGARLHSSIFWYFFPTMSNKVQDMFHYHSSQDLISVELPSNLSGFICYMVLSQGRVDSSVDLGCECYFETSLGERINGACSRINLMSIWFRSYNMMSDHVLFWYDAQYCKQIMDAVEGRKAINDVSTNYNRNLTFRFFVETEHDEVEIKECGFRWIYNSELESNIVQNRAEGFECDEQEETISLEVNQETKDLRCSLEELLHIGFCGDLMK